MGRRLGVALRQREGYPPSLLIFITSAVLCTLLPGRPGSPSLQDLHPPLSWLPAVEQSILPPCNREAEKPAVIVSADRPPTPLSTADQESPSLPRPVPSRLCGELPLPAPTPRHNQPPRALSPPPPFRHSGPLLSLPLQHPPEPATHSYFPAR